MKSFVKRLRRDEEGASLVEYAVLLGLLLAVAAGTLSGIGSDVNQIFSNVKTYTGTIVGGGAGAGSGSGSTGTN